jgi:7-carboxy-7-deazaguanine synthase
VPELIEGAVASGVRHVVVTGGEPLIQWEMGVLTRGLAAASLHVTVESAGTVDPPFHCDLLSLSPKTSNSDPSDKHNEKHRSLRLDHSPISRLMQRFPEYQLKFVVEGAEDLPEILELLAELGGVDRSRVLLMAQGRTPEEMTERAPAVAALCLEHGFRYTPRLQLDLFGGGPGV